jgi:hypothetical protein
VVFFAVSPNAVGSIKELPFPEYHQTSESIKDRVYGITTMGSKVFYTLANEAMIVGYPYKLDKGRVTFGRDLANSEKIEIQKPLINADWRGITTFQNSLIVLDGANLALARYDEKFKSFTNIKTIAWENLMKPPRDRGGEAPSSETAAYRQSFKKNYLKTPSVKFAGLAPVADKWKKDLKLDEVAFISGSRIQGFPLVILSCGTHDVTQCLVARACNVRGVDKDFFAFVSGVTVHPKTHEIYVTSTKSRDIKVLKYNSCMNIQFVRNVRLPERIKDASSIFIDNDGQLFMSSTKKDDYHNATIYTWNKDQF